jgi:hypothetical protein
MGSICLLYNNAGYGGGPNRDLLLGKARQQNYARTRGSSKQDFSGATTLTS